MNKTIEFFKEISLIPRESGNEEKIADYIVSFAKERDFQYVRDEFNNVIIKKYIDNSEPVILQAHLDMVCEKDKDIDFNFDTDSIELIFKNGYISAKGTTLGADNGVGVAQILNILDSNIGRSIEAIFTTNEEVSMSGAENIDLSSLKGKVMINLDGFNADTILLGSAGFTDIDIVTNYKFSEASSTNLYKLELFGLEGGHSGFDIDKNRGNSITLLGELLNTINYFKINSFSGGSKINVIPSNASSIIETNKDINKIVNKFLKDKRQLYPNLEIKVSKTNNGGNLLSEDNSKLFINSILELKHEVLNKNNRGEVTTSLNLAVVNLENNIIQVGLRSSIDKEKESTYSYLKDYSKKYNYEFKIIGYQPGFYTSEDSKLVNMMKESYYETNNSYPALESLHIAVEVGLIKDKIKDLEVVIISPNIKGAHSTNEMVEIASIEKCDRWLLNFLNNYE